MKSRLSDSSSSLVAKVGPTTQHDPRATPVEKLRGVGQVRAGHLKALGVTTLDDLLEYFPRRYQRELPERPIAGLVPEQIQSARGTVVAVDYICGRGRPRFEATLESAGAKLALTWFNGAYLRNRIHPGLEMIVRGRIRYFRGLPQMLNPKWRLADAESAATESETFRPIYPASAALGSETIASIIARNLTDALSGVTELFDRDLMRRRKLIGRSLAYQQIHAPASDREAQAARRRIMFDELALLQLGLVISKRLRNGRVAAPVLRIDKLLDDRIRKRFSFELTRAQDKAIWQIVKDLKSGQPMNRLLQGDVGSGKTVVALYAMLVTVANKMQAAILAPTEVLAEQHFLTLGSALAESSVRIELITSRTKRASRGAALRAISDGLVHLVVGTQALIQQDVEFANLGLVVADEQHKLGVRQRASLKGKGYLPHYLVMTATPIPRTLALSYFADFDLSVIDQLPPGRKPIRTRWVRSNQAAQAYDCVREQVRAGRQAYIVLPQIDETALDDPKAVNSEFERLGKGALAGLRLAMLHGQMSTDEKQSTMSAFRDGRIDVLVATTVIEVGVDVPNATVMLIDNADRFGLSQLHQLRGRVGRGEHESHCILLAEPATESAQERLGAMCRTGDGFEIAEMDLKLRGPGEFFGTRQHGLPEMKLADVTQEIELLGIARDEALTILERDPRLVSPQNAALRAAMHERFGSSLPLAQVG
ncbi:MAG: ATP-dependent DNA helicase RecG [Tepidisphaeraceae bacterium]